MILYLDTSALVKLYIEESERETVQTAVEQAKGLVVATLSLAESSSMFNRAARDGLISPQEAQAALGALLQDWAVFERIPLEDHIAREAAALAWSKNLRGADAVQLASVALLSRERRGVRFLAFDQTLNQAAKSVVKLYPG